MAQNLSALTDTWMLNPTMFDPTQASNQFSNYNNAALPWPPTYNPGLAGGPVNAATGQPIQSFQDWQAANPGGMSINSTPAAPQAAQPQQQTGWNPGYLIDSRTGLPSQNGSGDRVGMGSFNFDPNAVAHLAPTVGNQAMFGRGLGQPQAQAAQQQGGGAGAPPNNWQAAINALANPGKVTTQGANVPLQTGYQPSGGVNQAFLNQAGSGAGMNQGFLGALRAIQGR